jgi:hypothetical protein
MATLSHAYTSRHDAEAAIERLRSTAGPAIRIEMIGGRAVEDARDAPIGTFAGTTAAGAATVGSYAGVVHSGREATGTFAGDPDTQRRGSFGDTDRDTVTTFRDGAERTRITTHRRLMRLLVDDGLDPAIAAADLDAVHAGHAVVLVHCASSLDAIAAVIDDLDCPHPSLRAAA